LPENHEETGGPAVLFVFVEIDFGNDFQRKGFVIFDAIDEVGSALGSPDLTANWNSSPGRK
jgi:hypothetical protein